MYKKLISFPKIIIILISTIVLFSLYFSKDFKLDESADTLLLENDPDLQYLREVNKRYGSEEFFILTYEPKTAIDSKSILELETFVKKININYYRQLGLYGFKSEALNIFKNNNPGNLEKCESVEMLRLLEQNFDIFGFITSINGPAVDTANDLSNANVLLVENKY